MMFCNGVFVPPTCPSTQAGVLPDLRKVPFSMYAGNFTTDEHQQYTLTEAFFCFGEADDDDERPNLVESEAATVPIDSALAHKIRKIAGMTRDDGESVEIQASENPQVAQIREALCNRVAQCRGVVDGECWALGSAAVRKVIEDA